MNVVLSATLHSPFMHFRVKSRNEKSCLGMILDIFHVCTSRQPPCRDPRGSIAQTCHHLLTPDPDPDPNPDPDPDPNPHPRSHPIHIHIHTSDKVQNLPHTPYSRSRCLWEVGAPGLAAKSISIPSPASGQLLREANKWPLQAQVPVDTCTLGHLESTNLTQVFCFQLSQKWSHQVNCCCHGATASVY